MQLPGNAILDAIDVKKVEDEKHWKQLSIMVIEEDFFSFFNIPLVAGKGFSQGKLDYQTEYNKAYDFWMYQRESDYIEEYVINRKAMLELGFESSDEAIGQLLQIQGGLGYFNKGIIVGVTDNFNYNSLYEKYDALLIMQRNLFLHCFMVQLDSDHFQNARTTYENVWEEIYPNYSADYTFMNEVFNYTYRNEMDITYLVTIFSILSIAVAVIGLIFAMAYIIRKRTKEIGLRKVHGATIKEIILMLNMDYIKYIVLAFVIAVPVAWYILHSWIERFAYRTSLDWYFFLIAGLSVLLVSVLSVSFQSWRAAIANPVDAIKIQ
jgi:putative ABC transport system permease protein